MKKLIFSIIALFFIVTSCDTNSGVSEAFSKYAHQEGVTSITVPGWLISVGAKFADLSDEEQELLESIDKVKVLSLEDSDINEEVDLHKEFQFKINQNGDYEELLTVRDENESVTIFGKMDDNVITEMIVLVGGDDNAMIYVKGEIRPELINNTLKTDNFLSLKF